MRVIEPSAKLLSPATTEGGLSALRNIEQIARVSHRSEDRQTPESFDRFLRAVVIQKGDWSVTEHETAKVIFRVDRGCTHEIVRHRLFSYTQESTRFVNYGKREMEFIIPEGLEEERFTLEMTFKEAETAYLELLAKGRSPEKARCVLPNALASTIVMTSNFRNWRHFFLMRTSRETHADLRRVTVPLLEDFKKCIPLLYDDIEPGMRQIDNLKKVR
jgi:thymidylate synthase (FAD)